MLVSSFSYDILFTLQDCLDQFLKILRLTSLLFHTLSTLFFLLFPLSFRFSTNFPVPSTLLFSIFTTFPFFLASSLTKANTTSHVQHILASLFSTVLHFRHSAIYSHCTTEIVLVTSPSLNDIVFIYIFTDPCRLLL